MYVPPFNRIHAESEIRAFVAAAGSADFITTGSDGYPMATLLPVVWDDDRVLAHFARGNEHWQEIEDDAAALLVCRGAQAYVSPSWYATKAEHGRVVPTWNYSAVHIRGRARIHDDPAWLLAAVTQLTEVHEDGRTIPWHVTDAPDRYVQGQLRGIVGVELMVEGFDGKAKLSQNRSVADREGVVDGLAREEAAEALLVAAQVKATLTEA